MQGAKTSKNILPYEGRVYLHKAASFKTIFENILTNLENSAKSDTNERKLNIKIIKREMRGNIENITQNTPFVRIVALILEPDA